MSRNAVITETGSLKNANRVVHYEKSDEVKKTGEGKRPWQHSLAFSVASTVIVALAGIAVYKVSGLSDALDSTPGQAVLGLGIVWTFVACFRRGLRSG